MRVLVNGVHLYFDVEGSALRPHGNEMREVPTLVLLHGGPGVDHSLYKPAFSALTDVAQVVYLDHRGNGRSDYSSPDSWNLAQWADDVAAFCKVVGIVHPFVYGASFGGMVAMAYAIRHPTHPGGLILVSTTAQAASHAEAKMAMFTRLGGEAVGALARRRFLDGDTSPEVLRLWLEMAVPLYQRTPYDPATTKRFVLNREATAWFNRPNGEGRSFNFLTQLAGVRCPTLVMSGTLDPMTPIECQRDIAQALPSSVLTYREFEGCGHGVVPDAPEEALTIVRSFIRAQARPRGAR
jgi:pimeloyl-ACP methyl ester carboxylesterase